MPFPNILFIHTPTNQSVKTFKQNISDTVGTAASKTTLPDYQSRVRHGISSFHKQNVRCTDAFWWMSPWQLHNSWIVLAFHLSFLSYDSPKGLSKNLFACTHNVLRSLPTPNTPATNPFLLPIVSVSWCGVMQAELICPHKYLVSITLCERHTRIYSTGRDVVFSSSRASLLPPSGDGREYNCHNVLLLLWNASVPESENSEFNVMYKNEFIQAVLKIDLS